MESFRRLFGVVGIFVSAGLLASTALWAAPATQARGPVRIDAAAQGQVIEAGGNPNRAELVTFGTELPSSLLRVAPDQDVRIAGWPVAPDERADVLLTRHEIYAPDAKIWKVGKGGSLTEVPRSKRAFFWGQAEGAPETWVFLAVDPDSQEIDGFASKAGEVHKLRPLSAVQPSATGSRQHVIAPSEFFSEELAKTGQRPNWGCGQEPSADLSFLAEPATAPAQAPVEPIFAPAITSLHTATLAVDTDNEFMLQKFNNNAASATSYIANLIAAMNVMYERDLKIRLLQGTTFLRPSTVADPYSGTTSTSAGLSELISVWTGSATYTSVSRALTMMLSGKSPSSFSAAGIARLNGLCSKSNGYSFSQVFKFAADTSSADSSLVGHELGHNFGSQHTHCYNPPIDTCYRNGGGGCYTGSTSCPTATTMNGVPDVQGTVMSYCHIDISWDPNGVANCSASEVFHPRTIDLLNPIVESRVNNCIFPTILPPTISAVVPAGGVTAGGTPVTITGTSFRAGASVTIGGSPATSVVVASGTLITAVAPAHAAGLTNVTVTNSDTTSATRTNGYFYSNPSSALGYYTVTPCRIVDTRNANGPRGGPALTANQQRVFQITGACGIPSGARAVSVNITVTGPAAPGFFGFYPGDAAPLGTSAISFRAGQTRAASAVLRLATNNTGTLGIQNASAGSAHVIVDVNGYFQ